MSVRGDQRCLRFFGFNALALVIALVIGNAPARAASPEFIHAEGARLVDGHGNGFAIKGINLGNWLVPEGYMFKFTRARAPTEITRVVESLVGPEEAARFWSKFRDVYVAEDDIRFIKAAGFNTVRVPLHWGLFVAPGDAGADRFEGEGWALLDRLVQWCRASGLRVIIDLHRDRQPSALVSIRQTRAALRRHSPQSPYSTRVTTPQACVWEHCEQLAVEPPRGAGKDRRDTKSRSSPDCTPVP